MFKVVSAEIKKMVSKPGIYILAILLAVVLVLGVFIYKPTVYEDTSVNIKGESVLDIYGEFYGNGVSSGLKIETDNNIINTTQLVNSYTINGTTYKEYINNLYKEFENNFSIYRNCAYDSSSTSSINTTKNLLLQSLTNLNNSINTGINNAQKGAYTIISTNKNYNNYENLYENIYEIFNVTVSESNRSQIAEICKEYEDNFKENFTTSIKSFKFPILDSNLIRDYTINEENTKYFIINNRMSEILNQINELKDLAQTDSEINTSLKSKDDMLNLINLYINTAKTYINLAHYELLTNAFSTVSTSEQLDLMYLGSESKYDANSFLIRYTYLFDNNKTEDDYAHPLTIGVASNHGTNAYDYAYFVLKLFSFIIIVYAIMVACHAIAGEIKEGSMRYLAIRPISRTKLYFGKLFAILLMSTIMIIFSAIIALCVGGAVYGFQSLKILTIFNGTTAITMHPIVMLLIYLISMFLELTVYASIALLFSTLFKSDLLSVTILLVLYLINTLLPILSDGVNSWLAFYPFSHISLYSMFGSSNYALSDNFLNIMFGAKIYASSNFILTILVIGLFIIIANLIGSHLFKRKEL